MQSAENSGRVGAFVGRVSEHLQNKAEASLMITLPSFRSALVAA